MEMETITRYASNEYIRKNNLDADSRVHLPEHMKKMFMGYPEYIEPLRLDFESTITYRKVDKKEIQTRPITHEEYERLDPTQKLSPKKIKYPSLIICAMFDIIVIIALIINFAALPKECWPMMVIILLVINLIEFIGISESKDRLIKPDSQIAEGNAVLLDISSNSNSKQYNVMVAFHDQESYVRSIRCSYRDYNMMSVGSKVYVKVKGSSAIAYAVK